MRGTVDRVPPGRALGGRTLPAADPPGAAGAAAGPAARGRSAPHGQGRGRAAGDQPQHRAQGLPRTGVPGPGGGAAGARAVRTRHAVRRVAGRARAAPPGPAALAHQGPPGGPGRREHRSSFPQHLSVRQRGEHSLTAVLQTRGLGKRYGRRWALTDCTLSIPPGHVVGLVGPNGAGKTTLLNLAVGLLAPTTGTIEVLGGPAPASPAQLARVGFLAQDAPVYAAL